MIAAKFANIAADIAAPISNPITTANAIKIIIATIPKQFFLLYFYL